MAALPTHVVGHVVGDAWRDNNSADPRDPGVPRHGAFAAQPTRRNDRRPEHKRSAKDPGVRQPENSSGLLRRYVVGAEVIANLERMDRPFNTRDTKSRAKAQQASPLDVSDRGRGRADPAIDAAPRWELAEDSGGHRKGDKAGILNSIIKRRLPKAAIVGPRHRTGERENLGRRRPDLGSDRASQGAKMITADAANLRYFKSFVVISWVAHDPANQFLGVLIQQFAFGADFSD
jgi:hypothetical protein